MNTIKLLSITLLSVLACTFTSCNDDDDEATGQLALSITDAPADDENLEGVFITVADVFVDGRLLENFERQTIEISAYTQGETKLMMTDEFEAGTYNEVQLVLDHAIDEDGNSPGSYAQTRDGNRDGLRSSGEDAEIISVQNNFNLDASDQTDLVIDMNLRKCMKRDENASSGSQYEFVSESNMESAFRVNDTRMSGEIEGSVQFNPTAVYDEVVVYAYEAGSYISAEANLNTQTNLRYNNAVTSAHVRADGSYTLSFLEEGEYKVVAAGFNQTENGRSAFNSDLNIELLLNGSLVNTIDVGAESSTTVDLNIL